MSANLQNPIFHDEAKAREWLEARVWPQGPVCPHCGNADPARIRSLKGKAHRAGVYQCNEVECRKQFSVTVKTVFERSKIPLTKWLAALFLLVSSKKGISAHQIHRSLGITYKSAWFLMHRLREAMKDGSLGPLGGTDKVVEADETYWGNRSRSKVTYELRDGAWHAIRPGHANQMKVASLVERGGHVRSVHVAYITANAAREILVRNADRASHLMTDESNVYTSVGREFASHSTVNHGEKEYARGPVTTNTIEGCFSIFKRGMRGTYQHCGEKHLQRYLTEFDYRYNTRTALGWTDQMRAEKLAAGIVGKRLTYRRAGEEQTAA